MKNYILIPIMLVFCFYTSSMFANTTPQFYFFGDSLSDGGVMDQNSSLPEGRKPIYTNAIAEDDNVWPFYLSQIFSTPYDVNNNSEDGKTVSGTLHGNNYAAGGAVTNGEGILFKDYTPPSLDKQITRFIAQHENDTDLENNIYFIWIGANDYLKILSDNMPIDNKPIMDILKKLNSIPNSSTKIIIDDINKLHKIGSPGHHPNKFFIINLPDLRNTPFMKAFINDIIRPIIPDFSNTFNVTLITNMQAANYSIVDMQNNSMHFNSRETSDDVEVIIFNTYSILNDIVSQIKKPAKYQYTFSHLANSSIMLSESDTGACKKRELSLNLDVQAIACSEFEGNASEFLFADIVHPSVNTHKILADMIADDLLVHHWIKQKLQS